MKILKHNIIFYVGIVIITGFTSYVTTTFTEDRIIDKKVDEFMSGGDRFTYQDGLVLYLICDKENITPEIGRKIKALYDEHGQTGFRQWLLDNSKVHN